MATASQYRCRGLRKWCKLRCEATSAVPPIGYPTVGFYCTLHKYQEPKIGMDGAIRFDSSLIEDHVRSRTSFVAPEASVAIDMSKAPGVVRDRPEYGRSAAGPDILHWLKERRGMDTEAAMSYAQRMIELGMLSPVSKAYRKFSVDRNALYYVNTTPAGSGAR